MDKRDNEMNDKRINKTYCVEFIFILSNFLETIKKSFKDDCVANGRILIFLLEYMFEL